jgi:hypothetical protein
VNVHVFTSLHSNVCVCICLVDRYRAFNNTCREAAVSHFQAWKHNYLTHTTRPPPSDTHALVLSEFGFIPLRLPDPPTNTAATGGADKARSSRNRRGGKKAGNSGQQLANADPHADTHVVKTFAQLLGDTGNEHMIDAGKLTPEIIMKYKASSSSSSQEASGKVQTLSAVLGGHNLASVYCGVFNKDLSKCVCSIMYDDIRVTQVADNYNYNKQVPLAVDPAGDDMVTFITAAWADDYYSGALDTSIDAWNGYGHKVRLLLHIGLTVTVTFGCVIIII